MAHKASGSTRKGRKAPEPKTQAERVRALLARSGDKPPKLAWVDKTDPTRHLVERQKKLYKVHHGRCLVDFASKDAAKTWPGYVILPNGDQGPSPESLKRPGALEEYKRRYGWFAE